MDIVITLKFHKEEIKQHLSLLQSQITDGKLLVTFQAANGVTKFASLYNVFEGGKNDLYFWDHLGSGNHHYMTGVNHDAIMELYRYISSSLIYISGKRTVPENQPINGDQCLNTMASNFYSVMHALHNNNEEIFDEIERTFIKIFPDVKRIRTTVNGASTNVHLDFGYKQNSVPLHECGSGFMHALIMLCTIINENGKVILFDEPHSFLHPTAEKAIYDTASNQRSNQYIFTTHSPILINYPVDKHLYLLSKEQGVSKFDKLDDVRIAFEEIGISNSDFALSEKVLFVEGYTEELVLPYILRKYGVEQFGYNYRIINMEGCGNVLGKPSRSYQTFEKKFSKLSSAPIPYRVLLDRDENNEQAIDKIKAAYNDKVVILNRRELENYFLIPNAIKDCLAEFNILVEAAEVEDVLNEILNRKSDRTIFPKKSEIPIEQAKGSKVLELIFNKYGLDYNKKLHGLKIVQSLLANSEGELEEIARPLIEFIKNN